MLHRLRYGRPILDIDGPKIEPLRSAMEVEAYRESLFTLIPPIIYQLRSKTSLRGPDQNLGVKDRRIRGLAFSSLAALAPRMLVLRISRRSLSLAPRNAIKYPVFYYLGPGSR